MWNVHLPDAEWFPRGHPAMDGLVREVWDQRVVAIDTETTGLNIIRDVPLYWSMAWGERRVCLPADTLPFFKESFAQYNKRWIFANAKYDMHILENVGFHINGDCCDSQVMHALIYEEQPHDLKSMAREVLGWRWTDFKETFGVEGRNLTIQEMLFWMEKNNLQKLVEYASNDAYGTLKIYEKLKKELEEAETWSLYPSEFPTMADIFFKTEMPFTKVLWKCERNGIKVNAPYLQSISGPCQADIVRIEKDIVKLAGRMVNPNSPDQLRSYFLEELKLKPLMMTKGGKSGVRKASIDAKFLEHYSNVPMCKLLLEHRELTKLKTTYIDGLQKRMDSNERIHCRFNQDIARTGRLSSSDPNMQNIPKPENDKFRLRGAFTAPDDKTDLIVVDYEALEMRLLAAAAMDPLMTQIFLDGKDIHMGNAEMVFGRKVGMDYAEIAAAKKTDKKVKEGALPESAMTDRVKLALKFRNDIKSVAFGLNYGMREGKLSRQLGCSKEEALELMEEYMDTYPAVKEFYKEAIADTEATGFSYTIIGRRRYHPEIRSSNRMDRAEAERKAVNNNIQGGAADVVRFAMLMIDIDCDIEYQYGAKMLLQVHDELVFECPKETVKEAKAKIKARMEHPFITDLSVPLTVSIGSGADWLSAK